MKTGDGFVNESHMQFALREMRRILSSRVVLAGLAVTAIIFGLSGPFETFAHMALGPRLVYWAIVIVLAFSAGGFFGTWAEQVFAKHIRTLFIRIGVIGLASGVPVFAVVMLINLLAFGVYGSTVMDTVVLLVYCIAISTGVALMFAVLGPKPNGADAPDAVRLLTRVAAEKRGRLISLSVSDHYVEVTTTRGRDLVLMRLSDAMAEAEGEPGVQIHRSHWVALAAIKAVKRRAGKLFVTTSAEMELPVSRTFVSRLKAAGFSA